MPFPEEFAAILAFQASLAPHTRLKVGGPAEVLAEPRSVDELARLLQYCRNTGIATRLLGNGCNLLVRDEGVKGVVIRLSSPEFTRITVHGRRARAGAGAAVSALISEAARHRLAGLEALIGIPGSVGGALRVNAGSRAGYIGQAVDLIEVLDAQGRVHTLRRQEMDFSAPGNPFDEGVIVAAEFELEPDDPNLILQRLRKTWIRRKAEQPFSFQAHARLFKDPRGGSAAQLISDAGLVGARVGGAEISDRHPNYVVTQPGAAARDVLRLIDLVRSKVQESSGQTLELELSVW